VPKAVPIAVPLLMVLFESPAIDLLMRLILGLIPSEAVNGIWTDAEPAIIPSPAS